MTDDFLSDGAGTCLRCNTMQSYWELNQQIGTLLPSLSHNQLGIQIHPNANVQGRFLKLYIFFKAESVYSKNCQNSCRILEYFIKNSYYRWLLNSFRILQEFICGQFLWQNSNYIFHFCVFFLNFTKIVSVEQKAADFFKGFRRDSDMNFGIPLKKPAGFLYFFTTFFFQPRLNLDWKVLLVKIRT